MDAKAFGVGIFVVWVGLSLYLFYVSAGVVSSMGLSFPSEYASITRTFVLATLSLWFSQVVVSLPRLALWAVVSLGGMKGTTYDDYRRMSKMVHSVSVWALGSVTAMAAFLTQWLSPSG